MKNIVWKKPDNSVAITRLTDECKESPQQHAQALLKTGCVPADWVAVAFDAETPPNLAARHTWRWDGAKVVVVLDSDVAEETP